jgi:serine/threonine protein kinase
VNSGTESTAKGRWKIADFGLTSEGTSDTLVHTSYARGKPGYRAPELLGEPENRVYNNKVDLWSLGCIIYELFTGKRPFADDFAVREFRSSGVDFEPQITGMNSESANYLMSFMQLLKQVPKNRPTAYELKSMLHAPPTSSRLPRIHSCNFNAKLKN